MDKNEVLKRLTDCGVIAVVRAENAEQAINICEACRKAGIVGIELTFTVPGALDVIKALTSKYTPDEMLVGAGTVLDSETARAAILAGANYVVSPYLDAETVKLCNRYQVACMPGAMTIKEVVEAMNAEMEKSDFFRSLTKTEAKETGKSQK
jgi:2-dehydro-3-deoxyphosphogluconate aldolase/(4S)-4-hydroxy-2-oxoglutarate aldolase